jgi:serine/threonine-protein kinase
MGQTSLTKIGRYEVIGELGKGAMGVVYKATDPTIGRVVALKTMRLDVHGAEAEEMLARFRNEARLAGVLKHPNIVTIYDAGEAEGLFYIAMEFIEGQTLQSLLSEKHKLPPERVITLAQQVCAGLDAAAQHNVVHRDIKPANIMLETGGVAKIMDFGIAKHTGGLTSTGQVLGTPNYMSPEQVKGEVLDGRSDLFSFGVVLYEMLTGEKPFNGDQVTTIIYKIVHEDPPSPREVDVSIHPVLSAIIGKALAKPREARYQSGAELVRDLMNYKSLSAAAPANPDDSTTRMPSGIRAVPTGAVAAAAAKASVSSMPAAKPSALRRSQISLTMVLRIIKQSPWLATIAGVLIIVIAAVGANIAYVRHSRAMERAELERLLTQQQQEAAAAAQQQSSAATTQPSTVVTAPAEATPVPTVSKKSAKTSHASAQPAPAVQNAAPVVVDVPTVTGLPTGDMVMSSIPAGAQIQVDGKSDPAWKTPYTAQGIAPGAHTVTFSLAGYVAETRLVELTAGHQAIIAAKLQPQPGTLSLDSDPPGAEIFVDGSDAKKITPAQLPLAAGDHKILLRETGYGDLVSSIHLNAGQIYNFSGSLPPIPKEATMGRFKHFFVSGKVPVEIRTRPKGAQVLIDGVAQAHTTPLKIPLQPGSYDLVLKLAGYKDLQQSITVGKDAPVELDEVMEKQ